MSKCFYATGDYIEVNAPDFTKPGFPRVWHPGTVEEVCPLDGGLFDVRVRLTSGDIKVERVGKRGGNRNLRNYRG